MATRTSNPGTDWLASCAPDPVQVYRAWDRGELALIRSGLRWVAVEAAIAPTVTAMQRIGPAHLGPVLVYPGADRAWWLLPPQAEESLSDLPQLTVHPAGWMLRCPPADQYVDGLGWLEKPDGVGRLTDSVALGAAFGPAATIRHPAGAAR